MLEVFKLSYQTILIWLSIVIQAEAAIWEYRLVGDLSYYPLSDSTYDNCCVFDGGMVEVEFRIDDLIH